MKLIGLELSGTGKEDIGYCYMTEAVEKITILKDNKSVISLIDDIGPDIVAIDAPLSFPEAEDENIRAAERELEKRNIKFVAPIGLKAVEKLVRRAKELKEECEGRGILVLETFSGAFYDLLEIPRRDSQSKLRRMLKVYGLTIPRKKLSKLELNATTAAFTGRLFLEAKVEFLGESEEGQIVIPKVRMKK